MRRALWVVSGVLIALVLLSAPSWAAGGEPIPRELWDIVRGLTWPGATVAALFSPVGRALASWVQARVTPQPTSVAREQELADMAEVLKEVVQYVRRGNEVQARTVEAIVQVQQSLAVLLDRTQRRAGGGNPV